MRKEKEAMSNNFSHVKTYYRYNKKIDYIKHKTCI